MYEQTELSIKYIYFRDFTNIRIPLTGYTDIKNV